MTLLERLYLVLADLVLVVHAGFVAFVVCGLALIWIGTFQQILLYSGFIMLLFATLTVSCLFKIKEGPRFGPSLYRVVPALFMLVNIAMLTGAAVSHPRETTAGALTVAAGIPVYFLYRRRNLRGG